MCFCLVSSILTYTDVPSTKNNHYVKLFLSSCRRLWQSTVVELTGDESTDPVITGDDGHVGSKKRKKNQKTTVSSKRSGTKSTETKKQKEGLPFFASGSNYLSALNIRAMLDHSGHIRGAWEGVHESYIQEVKRELSIMRHTVDFLATTLRKILYISIIFPQ